MSPILQSIANGSARGYGAFGGAAGLPPAFESIATANGNGSSATITFSSIPSGFESLHVRAITKYNQTVAADYTLLTMQINGNALTHSHELTGSGVGANASSSTSSFVGSVINNHSSLSNMMSVLILDIHDYSSTTRNKTVRSFSGLDTNGNVQTIDLRSAFINNTAAITSISFSNLQNAAWTTTTQFALYGIKGA